MVIIAAATTAHQGYFEQRNFIELLLVEKRDVIMRSETKRKVKCFNENKNVD